MKRVTLTDSEFQELRDLQLRYRMDWPATFRVSPSGDEIWPWITTGLTPRAIREDVRGVSSVLDGVAEIFLGIRTSGADAFSSMNAAHFINP